MDYCKYMCMPDCMHEDLISEVLNCMMSMVKDFIVPKDSNFHKVHKRAYPHMKDCIGVLDGIHVRVSLDPSDQMRYIGKNWDTYSKHPCNL
jgi:hypothetical protein